MQKLTVETLSVTKSVTLILQFYRACQGRGFLEYIIIHIHTLPRPHTPLPLPLFLRFLVTSSYIDQSIQFHNTPFIVSSTYRSWIITVDNKLFCYIRTQSTYSTTNSNLDFLYSNLPNPGPPFLIGSNSIVVFISGISSSHGLDKPHLVIPVVRGLRNLLLTGSQSWSPRPPLLQFSRLTPRLSLPNLVRHSSSTLFTSTLTTDG